jgi:hypothetical protein
MMNSRERRLFSWSNATCAMPLCEALSSRRGLRPYHAQKDRVGSWEVSCLTVSVVFFPANGGLPTRTSKPGFSRSKSLRKFNFPVEGHERRVIALQLGEPGAVALGLERLPQRLHLVGIDLYPGAEERA